MAELLFRLKGVPEDEADEVRQLLMEHQLDFYETHEGFWRLGVAALWLTHNDQLQEARALIDEYQGERLLKARAEASDEGLVVGLWRYFFYKPLHFVMTLFAIAFVVVISLVPFFGL